MNITELARRLRVRPDELREKLPDLGFAVGKKAIKIDNRQAHKIMKAWGEMRRKERLAEKVEQQKALGERGKEIPDSEKKPITLPSVVTVRDLASTLGMPVPRIMQELMQNGILASINQNLDFDTASILAEDLGFKATLEDGATEENAEAIEKIEERINNTDKKDLNQRPPVIVVMGHVDHGKTKLLDAIRQTNVADTEAGGITQHIGAYQVERKGKKLTFIDTPGHEAFTVMRSRGAKVADMAILVIAADDGVQPQTREAINIIKSAEIPFVVALNKIDREQANLDKVKGELSEFNLVPEDWGGSTIMVPISAKQGTNIEDLLDMLLIVEEMEQESIVANADARAIGTVIESHVDPGAGPVATVLVQNGTLKTGDDLGIGKKNYGRVRAMFSWKGEQIEEATPSMPAKIFGWKSAPAIGDIMEVPEDVKELERIKSTDTSTKATEEVASIRHSASDDADDESKNMLKLIVKADVLGSLEAILGMLDKIKHDEVGVKVVQKGLGNITEADVNTAEASEAIIIGFNVNFGGKSESIARDKKVEVRKYSIIYKFFEDIIADLEKLVPAETIIHEQGRFEVLKNFRKLDNGWIIGGKVLKDKILPGAKLRLSREGEYIGEGEVIAFQLGPAPIKVAREGQECGMKFKGRVKPEEGDVLEAYTVERIAKELKLEGINLR